MAIPKNDTLGTWYLHPKMDRLSTYISKFIDVFRQAQAIYKLRTVRY